MKLFLKTVTRGGFYTFLIVLGLLAVSTAMGIDEYGNYTIVLNMKLYLACTLCGYIIALAGLIFETPLDPIIKRAIHFVLLLGGFIAIFATSESGSGLAGRKVLIAVFLYALAYPIIFLAVFGAKKIYFSIVGTESADADKKATPAKEKYTPRFKK